MTNLQLIRFIRSLIEVAIEAAETSINDYGRSYLHVSVEKVDHSIDFTQILIDQIKSKGSEF